jgi:hypothetical protein
VKRLAASFVVAPRGRGLKGAAARDVAVTCVRTSRESMAGFSQMRTRSCGTRAEGRRSGGRHRGPRPPLAGPRAPAESCGTRWVSLRRSSTQAGSGEASAARRYRFDALAPPPWVGPKTGTVRTEWVCSAENARGRSVAAFRRPPRESSRVRDAGRGPLLPVHQPASRRGGPRDRSRAVPRLRQVPVRGLRCTSPAATGQNRWGLKGPSAAPDRAPILAALSSP